MYDVYRIFTAFRTIFAVYEMVGTEADQSKAEELFNRLDMNADGIIICYTNCVPNYVS